ncbi:MAG: preprotein translocase subunit YajC [Burkholderiaceae bacterium]|uniref:Sec translocon accessory complex subunit YajC n=2 Tax=Oxalobacteraceae TaxID=75682 RepID=A0ABS0ERK8_9BURK|nr:preprotein translocase subunit YajC [Herminiimonas contaminans]MBX9800892.1 preprotein translocase subunit YajC [Burkholderiaceae bacterium]
MFISNAYAATAAGGVMGNLAQFVPIILMFVVLYFLMIRPQMKRQKEHKAMIEAVTRGDEVVTAGGVLGKITKVSDVYLSLEVQDGTEIVIQKSAVTTLLPKGTIKSL